jgi:DNA-binding beta-propeller fold protein YncE
MGKRTGLVAFGFCALSTFASASYELVMVVDSTAASPSIRRYDGNTGAFLGSFGLGYFRDPDQIAVNPSTGEAFVTDLARGSISRFKYSTGEYVSEITVSGLTSGGAIAMMPGGDFVIGGGSTVRKFSPSGTLLGSFFMPAAVFALGVDSTSRIHAADVSGNYRRTSSSLVPQASATLTSPVFGSMFVDGSTLYAADYDNDQIDRYTITTSGLTANASLFSGASDFPLGVAPGHAGRAYFAGGDPTTTTTAVLMRGSVQNGISDKIVSLPSSDFRGVATVVAPEPASMLAITAGLTILMKRKKR